MTKYCGKEEKLLLRYNFSSFPQYFQYISFVKCGCSINFFLNSANLICRGTDISKYFRQSLGLRDNESRLYVEASSAVLRNNYHVDCCIETSHYITSLCNVYPHVPHNIWVMWGFTLLGVFFPSIQQFLGRLITIEQKWTNAKISLT